MRLVLALAVRMRSSFQNKLLTVWTGIARSNTSWILQLILIQSLPCHSQPLLLQVLPPPPPMIIDKKLEGVFWCFSLESTPTCANLWNNIVGWNNTYEYSLHVNVKWTWSQSVSLYSIWKYRENIRRPIAMHPVSPPYVYCTFLHKNLWLLSSTRIGCRENGVGYVACGFFNFLFSVNLFF